jgi:hypothetical protein
MALVFSKLISFMYEKENESQLLGVNSLYLRMQRQPSVPVHEEGSSWIKVHALLDKSLPTDNGIKS